MGVGPDIVWKKKYQRIVTTPIVQIPTGPLVERAFSDPYLCQAPFDGHVGTSPPANDLNPPALPAPPPTHTHTTYTHTYKDPKALTHTHTHIYTHRPP